MTVPTNSEDAHSEESRSDEAASPSPSRPLTRRRGLVIGAVVAVGLGVGTLVAAFPYLAIPIGTGAAVVGAVAPLVSRVGRGAPSSGEGVSEP